MNHRRQELRVLINGANHVNVANLDSIQWAGCQKHAFSVFLFHIIAK